jgi:hypothetical protein
VLKSCGEWHSKGNSPMIDIKTLPLHRCQSKYCVTEARFWDGKIVGIADPGDTIVGWCTMCQKFVCSHCAIKVDIPEDYWDRLPDPQDVRQTCRDRSKVPQAFQCRRCGIFLGIYDDILVWKRLMS